MKLLPSQHRTVYLISLAQRGLLRSAGLAGLLLAVLLQALFAPAAYAAAITVNSLADTQAGDGECTLREALINADNDNQSGSTDCTAGSEVDTINFSVDGTILLGSALPTISQPLIIDGTGQSVIVDGGGAVRVFNATATLTMTHMTVQNGNTGGRGGGIRGATLILSNVNVLSNTATLDGGGVAADAGITLIEGLFSNNRCTGNCSGGGVSSLNSDLTITGTQFISNTGNINGGGAHGNGIVSITNGYFESNQATNAAGGGLAQFAGWPVTLTNTTFISNTAVSGGGAQVIGAVTANGGLFQANSCTGGGCDGGGLYAFNAVTLNSIQFISNTAVDQGGGLRAGGAVTANNSLFQANSCTGTGCVGGGLWANSTLNLANTQFLTNTSAGNGGGAFANGATTMSDNLFQNNQCTEANCSGGGLYGANIVTLTDDTFTDNSSAGGGGGLYAASTVTLNGGLFQNNQCTGASCSGGGVLGSSTGTVSGTTFLSNTAGGSHGGGAWFTGAATVTGATFTSNTAANQGGGLRAAGALILTNSSFFSNTAGSFGGGVFANTTLLLTDTNFISNTSLNDGGGAYAGGAATISGGLFQTNSCTASCSGGGVSSSSSNLTITGTQFVSNTAGANGGGAHSNAVISITDGYFESNQASNGSGGALAQFANQPMTLIDTTFISNTATGGGGGTYARGAVTLAGGLFQNNQCTGPGCSGGGILGDTTGTVNGTTFLSNTAGGSHGGGAWFTGAATVTGATFTSNTAVSQGGGLRATGVLILTNSSFFSNTAGSFGGGVFANDAATVSSSSFQNNHSTGSGAGGLFGNTTLVMTDTDFISNTAVGHGGGLLVNITTTISEGLFQANSCTGSGCTGGGLRAGGALILTDTQIITNTSLGHGGGAYGNGATTISGGLFQANSCTGSNCNGGGIYVSGVVTLTTGVFQENSAGSNQRGGGAYFNSTGTISGSQFISNTFAITTGTTTNCGNTGACGGGFFANGAFTVTNTELRGNISGNGGGAFFNSAATLNNLTFTSNPVSVNGGGAYFNSGATLNDITFTGNTASTAAGGGAYFNHSTLPVIMTTITFTGNTANTVGGGAFVRSPLTLTDTTFSGNSAGGIGGGLYTDGIVALNGGLFQNNQCTGSSCSGGGIFANNLTTITGTTFYSNTAGGANGGGAGFTAAAVVTGATFTSNRGNNQGGGVWSSGTLSLTNSNFFSNTAGFQGGGLRTSGAATISGGSFQNNRAISNDGGGLYAGGNLIITNTQIVSNTANVNGGGLYHFGSGTGQVVNILFARNSAAGNGEALYLNSSGSVQLLHTTIASPTLNNGAAVYIATGTVNITNTLIASHTTAIQRAGGVVSEDYNLFFGNTTNLNGTITSGGSSLVGAPAFTDPTAGVDDYRLTATSAAINAGANEGITTDFEGQARPQAGGVDIGYDESGFTSQAELTLVKTVTPATALPGQTITYTLTFTNSGPQVAQEVRITDSVPVELSGVTYQAGGVIITDTGAVPAFAWEVQDLVPGQNGVITLTGVVNNGLSGGAIFTNTASIASGATDNDLTDNTGEVAVTVSNSGPVLTSLANQTITETFTLTFTASATDSNGDTLSYGLSGAPAGATLNSTTGQFSWTPTEAQGPGTYTFTVIVTDTGSLTDSQTLSVVVLETGSAPVLTAISNQTITETFTLTFTASATDSDIPTQTLTYGLTGAPAGTSINSTTGQFSWTPTEAQGSGVYTFTVVVSDTDSLTDSTTVSVTVNELNTAPSLAAISNQTITETFTLTFTASATDDDLPAQVLTYGLAGAPAGASINSSTGLFSWTPTEAQGPGTYTFTVLVTDTGNLTDSQAISVAVLETDSAPVLVTISNQTITETFTLTFTASATDGDIPAQVLTYGLINEPAGATLNSTTGQFSWTPTEAQGPGTYIFSLIVTDTSDLTDTVVVMVTVAELSNAPVLAAISDQTITETFTLTFTASATDGDFPAQTLTYGLDGEPAGASINSSTGLFSWTPTEAQGPGSYTFTVVVSDTDNLTGSTTVRVTVNELNTAPVLAAVKEQTITETFTLTFTASAADGDAPAQTLTYGLINGPAGASLDSSTGQFSWTPAEAQGPGSYVFSLIVTDTGGLTNTTVVTVTVNESNSAPALAAIPNQIGTVAQALSFTAVASDSDIPANNLTYSLASAPTGATIEATTGLFTWTPASAGLYTVTVMVADDGTPVLTDTIEVVITVSETPASPLLYLPLIVHGTPAAGPDLVVESLVAAAGTITVTIRNAGDSSVTDAFWLDVYFNPSQTPAVNKEWQSIAQAGAAWGVTETLDPGETLTLVYGGAYFFPGESNPLPLPVGAQVYALVDSINHTTSYGNVSEIDESNNLAGPVISAPGQASVIMSPVQPASLEGLPER